MKPTTRAPFQPVNSDIDDDKLEQLAKSKGVGAFVKPAENDAPKPVAQPVRTGPAKPKPDVDVTPEPAAARSPVKSLNLELPDYVWVDLKIRAAQKQTSLKHVVMTALLKDGVTIKPEDMIEDGRRLR